MNDRIGKKFCVERFGDVVFVVDGIVDTGGGPSHCLVRTECPCPTAHLQVVSFEDMRYMVKHHDLVWLDVN